MADVRVHVGVGVLVILTHCSNWARADACGCACMHVLYMYHFV